LVKLNPSGTAPVCATFLPDQSPTSVTVDANGNATLIIDPATVNSNNQVTSITITTAQLNTEGSQFFQVVNTPSSNFWASPDGQGNLRIAGQPPDSFAVSEGAFANGASYLEIIRTDGGIMYSSWLPTGAGGLIVLGGGPNSFPVASVPPGHSMVMLTRSEQATTLQPAILGSARTVSVELRANSASSNTVQLSQLPSESWVIRKVGSTEALNQSINCEPVVYLRTTTDMTGWVQALTDAIVRVFQLLAAKWGELKTDESQVKALGDAAEAALRCVDGAYEKANRGLTWDAHRNNIYWLLDRLADRILTQWRTRNAEIRHTTPPIPRATRTRAPATPTRGVIDEFLNRVEADTGQKVDKTDFWLRITRDGTSVYALIESFGDFSRKIRLYRKGARFTSTVYSKCLPKLSLTALRTGARHTSNEREPRLRAKKTFSRIDILSAA
jgi:hypothetical protein